MTNPLIARFTGEPVLIDAGAGDRFSACLNAVMAHEMSKALMSANPIVVGSDFWTELGADTRWLRPYVVENGTLYIPVKGVLLKEFPYAFFDWATGYEYIRAAFDRGMDDSDVKRICLVVDSPGGMVAGNFDLADHIFASRGRKPILGIANEHAYSAAYSLISCVDPGRLTVARTGGVGSIGVVTMHFDVSDAMEKAGYKVTFIHAGKHKVEGNPYEPLADGAKARIQARIDALYDVFVSTVARNRGLDEEAVRKTEALTYSAPEALSLGLADSIGTIDDALADFSASLSPQGDDQMADITQADHDTAVAAARTESRAEGVTAGRSEGAAAERARVAAILDSEEAAKRPAAARMLAFDTDKDPESARAALAKLPEEKTEAAAPSGSAPDAFTARMDAAGSPDVGGNGGEGGDEAKSTVDQILADQSAVTGATRKRG